MSNILGKSQWSIIQWSVTQDRFQPCRLTREVVGVVYPHPQVLKVRARTGIRWHTPLRIILRYVPLRCHFLHFETMNECKPCTKLRQSSALACPKLLQARCLDKNGWETSEKWQRIMLKRLVKQRRKSFKNWENITRKWKAGNICRKIGGFWPKQEGRNLWHSEWIEVW